jgi:hypothetical protein
LLENSGPQRPQRLGLSWTDELRLLQRSDVAEGWLSGMTLLVAMRVPG